MILSRRTLLSSSAAIAALPSFGIPGMLRAAPIASGAPAGEWHTFGGDLGATRYTALDKVTAANFGTLEQRWSFHADNLGPAPDMNLQVTPLMVGRTLYLTAGTRRAAVALDAGTGELLWKYNLDEGVRGANSPRPGSGRGLAYWRSGADERIVFVTPGYRMIALDAKTGLPVPGFGDHGIVDLKTEIDQDLDLDTAVIALNATPLVVGDVIVVGAAHAFNDATTKHTTRGAVRGYDARTGKRLWIFHTVPLPGEVGHETWLRDSWREVGNTGAWAELSADPELGLVYVGVELPTGDWYGGNRPGAGLFGETIVALDVKTGVRRWHYQTIHHGMWDRDIPCAAILADIGVNGRHIKALAQPTKQSWLYVLDRETGKPVWPIPERPVPKGDVPGEWYSPTQPMVTKPPAFDVQGVSKDMLIDFTPELRAQAEALVAKFKIGPLYQPPVLSQWPAPLALIFAPGSDGSASWPGGALDPVTNILYIYSNSTVSSVGMIPADPAVTDFGMVRGVAKSPEGQRTRVRLEVQGLPLLKPPYGRITAIDLNKGDIVWQVPHGATPDEVRNHPALKGLSIPPTGSFGKLGILVTKTLIIVGDGTSTTDAHGRKIGWLRAYDKATGHEVGSVPMPSRQTGSPMSYMLDGKQWIVLAVSDAGHPGELVAYRLP